MTMPFVIYTKLPFLFWFNPKNLCIVVDGRSTSERVRYNSMSQKEICGLAHVCFFLFFFATGLPNVSYRGSCAVRFCRRCRTYFTCMYFCAGDRIPTATRGVVNGATQRKRVLFLAWHYCVQLCIPLRTFFFPAPDSHCTVNCTDSVPTFRVAVSHRIRLPCTPQRFLSCVNNALLRTPGASLATRANDFRRKKKTLSQNDARTVPTGQLHVALLVLFCLTIFLFPSEATKPTHPTKNFTEG